MKPPAVPAARACLRVSPHPPVAASPLPADGPGAAGAELVLAVVVWLPAHLPSRLPSPVEKSLTSHSPPGASGTLVSPTGAPRHPVLTPDRLASAPGRSHLPAAGPDRSLRLLPPAPVRAARLPLRSGSPLALGFPAPLFPVSLLRVFVNAWWRESGSLYLSATLSAASLEVVIPAPFAPPASSVPSRAACPSTAATRVGVLCRFAPVVSVKFLRLRLCSVAYSVPDSHPRLLTLCVGAEGKGFRLG